MITDHTNQYNEKMLKFFKNQEGVTAIEYALIAFLIAIAIIFSISIVSNNMNSLYSIITSAITTVI